MTLKDMVRAWQDYRQYLLDEHNNAMEQWSEERREAHKHSPNVLTSPLFPPIPLPSKPTFEGFMDWLVTTGAYKDA